MVETKINYLPSKRKTGENKTNFIRACSKVYFLCTAKYTKEKEKWQSSKNTKYPDLVKWKGALSNYL